MQEDCAGIMPACIWLNGKSIHLCAMKFLPVYILITLSCFQSSAQLIHAHNDYQKRDPLVNALRHKVFSIEADIYLAGNRLLVAHDKKDLASAKTLDSLYLQRIIELFRKYNGTISEDSSYAPVLMIDIKANGAAAIEQLIKLVSAYRPVFDRSLNVKAVQLVISGDRGTSSKWITYPSYILFDGRPNETYDSATLQRVAFISDSWTRYNLPPADYQKRLKDVVEKVHSMGKLLRLWASPDNAKTWKLQHHLGIDIINTDQVEECRNYFLNNKTKKTPGVR